jgi:hypothetical protein
MSRTAEGWWRTVRKALGDTAQTVRLIAILMAIAVIVGALASLALITYIVIHKV